MIPQLLTRWLKPSRTTRRSQSRRRPRPSPRCRPLLLEMLESRITPDVTVINVSTFNDVVDPDDGLISLREAIIESNRNAGEYEIRLQSGTYWLTISGTGENNAQAGDLDILNNDSVAIVGTGAGQTVINAGGNGSSIPALGDRVFDVHVGASLTCEVITITGGTATGNRGGGILNDGGIVVLRAVIVSGNSATTGGGVHNGIATSVPASLTITDSIISGNSATNVIAGGGIDNNRGSMTITGSMVSANVGSGITSGDIAVITRCTISGNTSGGGIVNVGAMTISGSTISNNTAGDGGGVHTFGPARATTTISNSTISGNFAFHGGGFNHTAGSLTITNCTITGNSASNSGGGIRQTSPGTVAVNNSIVAGNFQSASSSDIVGAVSASSSFNLIGNAGTAGGLSQGTGGNIVGNNGVGTIAIDTILNPTLANNGGATLTHALVPDSPAIDAGDPNFDPSAFDPPLLLDQRGFDRVVQGRLDIGAYEFRHQFLYVRMHSPAGVSTGFVGKGNGFVDQSIDSITLSLNKEIDLSSFPPAVFEITGQMGHVTPTGVTRVGNLTYLIDLQFPLEENGTYHFRLPPTVKDVEGFPLDQNFNGIPGEQEDAYTFDLVVDTVPPRIVSHTPAGDVAGTISSVDVIFSEAIDKTTFTTGNVVITRPNGQTLAVSGITEVGFNRFRVSFPAQTLVGTYHVSVGPDIRDRAGNKLDQNRNGIFGEATDVYDAAFNLVPVDLGLNNLVVDASQLVAGEPISVSWNGANQTGAPLVGDWTDAIYFSPDDKWDISDTLLGTVQHTGGLAQGEVYSGSATVVIPGALPGNYHILVRADVYNQENEGANKANNVGATDAFLLAVHSLPTDGTEVTGSLSQSDRSDYYAVHVSGGQSLLVTLDGQANTGANLMYVRLGAMPTRLDYDYRLAPGGQDGELVFTEAPGGGTYYVLVYGDQIGTTTSYAIAARTGPIFIRGITPTYHGNAQQATVTLTGAGFDDTTTVQFIGLDDSIHTPLETRLVSSSNLVLTLDLPTWLATSYRVRVTNSRGSDELTGVFTVTHGGTSNLQTNLVVPSAVGFSIPVKQTIWIEYKNTGDLAMPAPLLKLTGDHGARITADSALAVPVAGFGAVLGVTDTVQVLGLGSSSTPWILQPGESGRIPVYYIGLSQHSNYPQVTFSLSTLTADDNRQIDWASFTDSPRPETIPPDAWQAILANLTSQVGSQWGDYVVALDGNLNHLQSVGQNTTDIASLWSFAIAQASAQLQPVQTLAGSVDASEPATGLPLVFSRVYGESIISRYMLGPLGRGWSTNWNIFVQQLTNGDVMLRGPGGADRYFTHNLREGTFKASPGDFGQLTMNSGLFRLTETDGTVWQFRSDLLLDFFQDTNANRTTLGYTNGLLTSLTHSSGKQLLIEYNAGGRISRVIDPVGPGTDDDRITTYEYDASGEHLLRVIAPGNRITDYTYDTGNVLQRKHALTSVAYADGTHSFFAYDDRGRLIETSADGGAERVRYTFDAAGGVTVTDATDRNTFLAYGLNGRLELVRDGEGRTVDFVNCSCGHVTQITGPGGEKYGYSYDVRGNLIAITDPLGHTTGFTYDPTFNQLTSFTDPRHNGMQYGYDSHGNLTSITYEDGTHENFTYDLGGNVITATNRRGQTVTYGYNTGGEVTSKDYSTTPDLIDDVYGYDSAGNLTSARDVTGTTTMVYDPATNLLMRIDYPGGHFFTFEYDAVGRRTKRTDQDGNVENYFYDAAGRLDHMTDGTDSLIVRYEYDDAGRLSRKTLGNGVYTTYAYDAAGNITHLVNFKADGTLLSRFDYTYDASGRRDSMTTLDGTFLYGYDRLGQLTSVTYPDGHVVDYAYDAAGNRTEVTDNGVTTAYVTNNLNQYSEVGGVIYAFDLDGNLISKTEAGVTTTYSYDIENRLTGVTTPTDSWTYGYDPLGDRVAATHNGVATTFVIDPTGLGNVSAEYDGSGNLVARYDHGYRLLSRTNGAGAEFYTFSAIGNTSELTGATGTVLNAYTYDPFGISLGKTETVANPFEFVGEYGVMNEGNGLEFMRARYYVSQQGLHFRGPAGDSLRRHEPAYVRLQQAHEFH